MDKVMSPDEVLKAFYEQYQKVYYNSDYIKKGIAYYGTSILKSIVPEQKLMTSIYSEITDIWTQDWYSNYFDTWMTHNRNTETWD